MQKVFWSVVKMVTLIEAVNIMNKVADNPEVEVYIKSSKGKTFFVIEERVIKLLEGGNYGN